MPDEKGLQLGRSMFHSSLSFEIATVCGKGGSNNYTKTDSIIHFYRTLVFGFIYHFDFWMIALVLHINASESFRPMFKTLMWL